MFIYVYGVLISKFIKLRVYYILNWMVEYDVILFVYFCVYFIGNLSKLNNFVIYFFIENYVFFLK